MNKRGQMRPEEDKRYHDTLRLLKNYRDVVWSVELSVQQLKKDFKLEIGSDVDEFLDSVYMAGADLSGTKIESYARSIERSRKMLALLNQAIGFMRRKHKHGEEYYWILYYTYLSPNQYESIAKIIEQLASHIRDVSKATYFRKREAAVQTLSSTLWGYTSKDCLEMVMEFFPMEN